MKRMKKLASVLLALVMALSLAVPAFAAASSGTNVDGTNNTGKITIENPVAGQTYSAYQLLVLESYNNDLKSYSYKINNAWSDFFAVGATGRNYVDIDAQGYVTWKEGADAAAFAKAALAYAKGEKTADGEDATAPYTVNVAPTQGPKEVVEGKVEFTGLNLGYYLVDSSLGALCSLDTTNNEIGIQEKNSKPDIEKEVQEDSLVNAEGNGWQNANDAQIGQVVNYKSTVTVGKGAENYVLHDKMSTGLKWDGSVVVKIGETVVSTDNYTLVSTPTDGCTFEIEFDDAYMATLTQGTEIVVTYSATLTKDAVIYTSANTNETWLKYGDETNTDNKTDTKETKTYTYEFDLVKTDSKDGKQLAGAKFELYDAETEGNKIPLVKVLEDAEGNALTDTYRIATSEDTDTITEFEVPATGHVTILGLDANDSYWLEETVAPNGYNKLAKRQEVKVVTKGFDENGNVKDYTGIANATQTETEVEENGETTKVITWSQCVEVKNSTGSLMPSTGGIGTTIFYVVGGLMVAGAGILLVTKKRMENQ